MNINLIQGNFGKKEATDLVTNLIHAKIKFQENLITKEDSEEDIKMRENRIKQLQKDLYEARKYLENSKEPVSMNASIAF
ncbi:hypothetical protein Emtol_1034 [Emticicia oligotrophica DSM 17448]|uniref:Uncharacterized protein n=1 Tax=Emticicia oligotrophica (strain DSM 17448 / CIP 109782 / MTCC 6937 / GPTSA100-15) TaxID=929562 RepID=A0ABM5MYE6_EMTOG|nr:hypothetical protein [Emticicia oligotrophica]AFK02184.1 hypothetical protein Emtol_1034 [Emticicia oligotrophica DSM 17448]